MGEAMSLPELDAIKAKHDATSQTHWSIEYGNCGCSADGGCCKTEEVWPQVLHGPKNTSPPPSPSEGDNAVSEVAELSEADAEFVVFAHNSDVPRMHAALEAVLAMELNGDGQGYDTALERVHETVERALKEEQQCTTN